MKTSIKRIICLLFVLCLVVCAFSACSGGSDVSSSTPSNGSVNSDDPNKEVSANKASVEAGSKYDPANGWDPYATMSESIKGSTVRFATPIDHWNTEGAVPLENIYKDIGINADIMNVPQAGYVEAIKQKIATHDIPDVFKSNEYDGSFPLTLEIAQPIELASTVDLNEPIFDQSIIKRGTIGGHIYLVNTIGSPWSGSNLVYYNKALFEDNGFKTPAEYYEEGNWTWETMKKVMKDVVQLGTDYKGGYVDPEVLGDSAGVSFCMYDYNTNTWSSGVEKKELTATYQWYADARDEGLLGGGFQSFVQGKCGIVITGVYGLKKTGHFRDMAAENLGCTYLPALEDGSKAYTSSIFRMYGIVAGAPNADAAGYFIRYWLDPDNYDLSDMFMSNEAGNFYYELINNNADNKYFNFDDCVCNLIGEKGSEVFYQKASWATSAQVPTEIAAVKNKVNDAVAKANALMQKIIAANK